MTRRPLAFLDGAFGTVSKGTRYRHVALLAEAGFLKVAEGYRVRGAVEHRHRLRRDRHSNDGDAMTADDHRGGFAPDGVSYRQGTLWLAPDGLKMMLGELVVDQPGAFLTLKRSSASTWSRTIGPAAEVTEVNDVLVTTGGRRRRESAS